MRQIVMSVLFVFALVGCRRESPQSPSPEPKNDSADKIHVNEWPTQQRTRDLWRKTRRIEGLRWMWVAAYSLKRDGTPDVVLMTTDQWWDGQTDNPKLMWMEAGKKVILPGWFTWGKEAQSIPSDKLEKAWKDKVPGVYKYDYKDNDLIRDAFSKFEIEFPK